MPVSTMVICLINVILILIIIHTADGEVNCIDGVCQPHCVKTTSSVKCLHCQDSRFYGEHCENACPRTCLNYRCQLNNSRVVCTEGCVFGKAGDNCQGDCPISCTQCPKNNNASCQELCLGNCEGGCDRYSWECKTCKFGFTGRYCDRCMSGYRGKNCNETCQSSCIDGCDRDTGVCHRCKSGYRGEYCDETCPWACAGGCDRYKDECYVCLTTLQKSTYCDVNRSLHCKDLKPNTGDCRECEYGYKGRYCNETCPSNCEGRCDSDTEVCDMCKNGYRDKFCNLTCPSNCEICNRDTAECSRYRCKKGYRGRHCNIAYPPNCEGSVTDTGECYRCKNGYRGKYCNVTCSSNCERCQNADGCILCTNGYRGKCCNVSCPSNCEICTGDTCNLCKVGFRGQFCNVTCPFNCERCDNYTGACLGCKDDYKGKYCNATCPLNCNRGCDRYTGECYGCKAGHRGGYCNETCPQNCEGGCDRFTRECDSCVSGYRGRYCNSKCNANCQECDPSTGQCQQCIVGKKGHYCNATCPINCEGGCDMYTGECGSCLSGYSGRHCNSTCTVNCQDCVNTGYNRTYCDEICCVCGKKNCSKEHSITREANPSKSLWIICGVLATLLLLASVVVIVWRKYLQRCTRRLQGQSNSNHSYSTATYCRNQHVVLDEPAGAFVNDVKIQQIDKPFRTNEVCACAAADDIIPTSSTTSDGLQNQDVEKGHLTEDESDDTQDLRPIKQSEPVSLSQNKVLSKVYVDLCVIQSRINDNK